MGHAKKVNFALQLVTIPTRVEVAVDKESSGAHAICTGTEDEPHAPSRVKQTTACPVCGITHSSAYGFTKRGIERDGMLVEVTKEELDAAAGTPLTGGKDHPPIPLGLHPRDQVYGATLASDSVQNVYPDKGGEKAYVLLRDRLRDNPDVVAVVTWAPSSKNALWVLEVVDDRLVLSKRCYPEDVRTPQAIPAAVYSDQEAAFMDQLFEAALTDFVLDEYADKGRRGVEELVSSRIGTAPAAAPAGGAPASGDVLAALQASVTQLKPKTAPRAVKKTAAKKTAAKKTAVKKAAAKRPAKKTA